jgi:hypothetical protein
MRYEPKKKDKRAGLVFYTLRIVYCPSRKSRHLARYCRARNEYILFIHAMFAGYLIFVSSISFISGWPLYIHTYIYMARIYTTRGTYTFKYVVVGSGRQVVVEASTRRELLGITLVLGVVIIRFAL